MNIVTDLKYAFRLLAKKPGFTVLTILVMAAGITLSLFLFSFLHTMGFKPLPFKDGDSIVILNSYETGVTDFGEPLNLHDYDEIRSNLKGLSEFGAFRNTSVNAAGRDGVRRYKAALIEPNLFQITRTEPVLGRGFTPAENQKSSERVVVIGNDIWKNQFGGDPQIVDQTLIINGESHRIIGVMGEEYAFPNNVELWLPMRESAAQTSRSDSGSYYGVAHIDDGQSMSDVNRQLTVIMQRLEERYPDSNKGITAYVDTLQASQGSRGGMNVVYVMYVVAILILFLASINVGNLLLSRAVERSKETAIRSALGAPQSRLITQMLLESIIICSIGGVLGLLIAAWGLDLMNGIVATFFVDKPVFWWKFGVDAFTIKLFLAFVVGTVLVTGLYPAWKNSKADVNAVLRDGTRGALGKKAGRLNRILVIGEIFLSMVILIVASVILVSTYIATFADYGADTENTLTSKVLMTESNYDSPEKKTQFVRTIQSRLENNAGIGNVMVSSALPGEYSRKPKIALEGNEYTEDQRYPRANYIVTTIGSLEKLGVALKEGRYFNSGDEGLGKSTVIVTDSFVSRYFPNETPLGRRIRLVNAEDDSIEWLSIVGVVEHTVQGAANEESGRSPSVFRPYSQAPGNEVSIALQMTADRATVTRTLRNTLAAIDQEVPAYKVEAYTESIDRNVAPMRFISKVFLLFGVVAVVLAISGVYGVMSNTINQKTQEIGVKRALGAADNRIAREFLWVGIKQLIWGGLPGLAVGGLLGFAISQFMGTGTDDLVMIAIALLVIIGGAVMLATYFPTKRGLQMEPSEALRYE